MANTAAESHLALTGEEFSSGTYNRQTCQGPYLISAACQKQSPPTLGRTVKRIHCIQHVPIVYITCLDLKPRGKLSDCSNKRLIWCVAGIVSVRRGHINT